MSRMKKLSTKYMRSKPSTNKRISLKIPRQQDKA
uniref:Uncharacterized protein n=1 Tax=Rhizophora mucronata TaxID=61149 RepID=A0A2P2PYD3_RHIMU